MTNGDTPRTAGAATAGPSAPTGAVPAQATGGAAPADPPASAARPLGDAARRALAEAEARRRATVADQSPPREIDGRGGLEPARYGDWEVKGIASDF